MASVQAAPAVQHAVPQSMAQVNGQQIKEMYMVSGNLCSRSSRIIFLQLLVLVFASLSNRFAH